jgi:hypothetical protein
MNTDYWLKDSLQVITSKSILNRCGKSWEPVAGFSQLGCIFCIYKGDTAYCVHAGEEWKENEEPLLGYYDSSLSWDDLITQIAERYDTIRSSTSVSKRQ